MDVRPLGREVYSKGPVIIEENVWIGDKVTILPGVTVGQGAVIAANSVVSKRCAGILCCWRYSGESY